MTTANVNKNSLYHHIGFCVSNALQSAYWYVCNFGFERFAFRRNNEFSEIAIRNGKIILLFKTIILPKRSQFGEELMIHGDFIKDVAFLVDNIDPILEAVSARGLQILTAKHEQKDENGSLRMARIYGSGGDIIHSLIQIIDYNGIFLPGFRPIDNFRIARNLISIDLIDLDHIVEGHPSGKADSAAEWYDEILRMKRFWSIDDQLVHTQYSALKAIIVGETTRKIQMTLVEPISLGEGKRKGQVQEFLDYHGGAGIQHIAFRVDDISKIVKQLIERGVDFLDIPDTYYDLLTKRIMKTNFNEKICQKKDVEVQLEKIRELKILMDFDENGYLLQIFTRPMQDRPSLFVEIIQRHNYNGFGAGNFQALFQAVEIEQERRDSELFLNGN